MPESIAIPSELRRPHRFLTATRDAASGRRARDDGRIEIGPAEGIAHLLVSRNQLRRSLLVLHAIFQEAERRRFGICAVAKDPYGHRAGVGVAIRGHAYTLEVVEQTDRVPLTEAEIAAWMEQESKRFRFSWEKDREPPKHRNVANGRLRLLLPSRWHGARSTWSEGRTSMERQLVSVFAELERRAEEDDRRAEEHARRQEEWRRQEEERMERELRARISEARASRLGDEIAAWRFAHEIREYVAALRLRLDDLTDGESERVAAWCDWAEQWSRRTDPVVNTSRILAFDDDRDRFAYPRSFSQAR